MMQMQRRKNPKGYYNYVGIYIFSYAAMGTLVPLLGQYLSSIGFDGVQIGLITSTATAVGIFASPFWGHRYQMSKNSLGIVLFLCFSAAFVSLNLIAIRHYLLFLIIYGIYAFLQTPILPLTDAMTLEAKLSFGAIRKWGSIGFASGVFLSGQIAELVSPITIFPMSAAAYITAGTIMLIILKKKKKEKESHSGVTATDRPPCQGDTEQKQGSYAILFRNKKYMALLASAFFVGGTNIANNIYYGFLYTDAGGNIAGIGIAFLLMSGSEAPFMAWAEKLAEKFTMERLILMAMILSALRFLWYSTGLSPEVLIGSFFLQGMVNGIILVEIVRYIAKIVAPSIIGMAMTLYQAISSNCSAILCQMLGGIILDNYGSQQVYLFFGLFNIIGILLYTGFGLHKK